MGFNAFKYGANIIAYEKDEKKYGMCCAWSTQVDYDKIVCLLGSQSVTGKNIKKGDIIGVSALAYNQENIAFKLGDNHSDVTDKFETIDYEKDDNAILIKNAARIMKVEVIDVLHLKEIEEDNLIYGRIIKSVKNDCELYEYKG